MWLLSSFIIKSIKWKPLKLDELSKSAAGGPSATEDQSQVSEDVIQNEKNQTYAQSFSEFTYIVDRIWLLETIHTLRIELIQTLLLSQSIPLKGYGSTQEVIDSQHCTWLKSLS